MRITGGSLKGFRIPPKFASHVRPTTDMMREAVFNKLEHTFGVEGMRVLDLFTGSGAIALEFVSRGAEWVTAIDKDNKNLRALSAIVMEKEIQNLEMQREDAFRFLRNSPDTYDLIYADPPYDLPNLNELPALGLELLSPGGWFILEHRPGAIFTEPIFETRKHGSTAITIFAK